MGEFQRNLWAPWRMEYIDSLDADAPEGCFLCRYVETPEGDTAHHVLWRGDAVLVLLNRFPYSNGHVLVAPRRHVGSLDELGDDELLAIMHATRDARQVLSRAISAQGFNIGINLGKCAGAGLPDHIHVHIVPRWAGDVNYMAVLADVKVMPQALQRTAEAFRSAADELGLFPAG